jgi:hypothetical protein
MPAPGGAPSWASTGASADRLSAEVKVKLSVVAVVNLMAVSIVGWVEADRLRLSR